ncbi:unnamed protein product, partial [Amoebophrya sp. A25]|eukprot:GSA25T00010999001.1
MLHCDHQEEPRTILRSRSWLTLKLHFGGFFTMLVCALVICKAEEDHHPDVTAIFSERTLVNSSSSSVAWLDCSTEGFDNGWSVFRKQVWEFFRKQVNGNNYNRVELLHQGSSREEDVLPASLPPLLHDQELVDSATFIVDKYLPLVCTMPCSSSADLRWERTLALFDRNCAERTTRKNFDRYLLRGHFRGVKMSLTRTVEAREEARNDEARKILGEDDAGEVQLEDDEGEVNDTQSSTTTTIAEEQEDFCLYGLTHALVIQAHALWHVQFQLAFRNVYVAFLLYGYGNCFEWSGSSAWPLKFSTVVANLNAPAADGFDFSIGMTFPDADPSADAQYTTTRTLVDELGESNSTPRSATTQQEDKSASQQEDGVELEEKTSSYSRFPPCHTKCCKGKAFVLFDLLQEEDGISLQRGPTSRKSKNNQAASSTC